MLHLDLPRGNRKIGILRGREEEVGRREHGEGQ